MKNILLAVAVFAAAFVSCNKETEVVPSPSSFTDGARIALTLTNDADIGRGVHGPDGLRFHARHHEAARTFGCGGHLGEGAVIVGSRLLHEGRKGRPGLGRRGIVVRYGVE